MATEKVVTVELSPHVWRWLNAKKLHPREAIDSVLERMKSRQTKPVDEVVDELYTRCVDSDGEMFGIPAEQKWIVEDIVKAVLKIERGEL